MTEKNKGILYIICAGFCFACMTLFLKLSGDISSFEKSFFRNLVAIFFALGVMLKNKIPFTVGDRQNYKYLISRSLFGTIGIFCNFYAVDHLVIADANMLNKLSPFFAIIFSFFLLKEKVKPYQALCVIIAFFGTLLILKPGVDSLTTFPAFIGVIGGMSAGLAYTNVRLASTHGVKGPVIVLFFSVFSCIMSIPFSLYNYTPLSGTQLLFLLLAGLAATGGQFSITAAYSHAPAREISVYDYTQIIFAALLGMIVLGELPDALSFAGYGIICGAGILMFIITKKKSGGENQ
ncbi:MAG: DMT family transporter [Lachnospiraceae bacterium]|nr:DMT family transporter [Lachnospiraceae bacterium]